MGFHVILILHKVRFSDQFLRLRQQKLRKDGMNAQNGWNHSLIILT